MNIRGKVLLYTRFPCANLYLLLSDGLMVRLFDCSMAMLIPAGFIVANNYLGLKNNISLLQSFYRQSAAWHLYC